MVVINYYDNSPDDVFIYYYYYIYVDRYTYFKNTNNIFNEKNINNILKHVALTNTKNH